MCSAPEHIDNGVSPRIILEGEVNVDRALKLRTAAVVHLRSRDDVLLGEVSLEGAVLRSILRIGEGAP